MCELIRKHVACALIMAEGGGESGEIVPAPESTSFVDTTSRSERVDESTSILAYLFLREYGHPGCPFLGVLYSLDTGRSMDEVNGLCDSNGNDDDSCGSFERDDDAWVEKEDRFSRF